MDYKCKEWLRNELLTNTLKEIATKCNVSPDVVGRQARKFGIKVKTNKIIDRAAYLDEPDEIVDDYCAGLSMKQLAHKYSKTIRSIDAYLRRRRITTNSQLLDKQWLFDQMRLGQTIDDIAKTLSVNKCQVIIAFKLHGVTGSVWQRLRAEGKSGKELNTEHIIDLYLNKKWPSKKIANFFGYSGDGIVRDLLRDNNIRVRCDGESNIKHSNPEQILTILNDKQWLEEQYITKYSSSVKIAEQLGVNPALVQSYLKKHNIKTRASVDYQNVRRPSGVHLNVVTKYLDDNNIKHITSFIYNGRYNNKDRKFEIDEYLPEHKMFIEIQGIHWHGLTRYHWKYQRVRSKMWSDLMKYLCVTRDYPDHKFIYLREDELKTDRWMIKLFKKQSNNTYFNKNDYRFTECIYNDIKDFIIENHYLQSAAKGNYYALYRNEQLVAACVISSPTRVEIKLSNGQKCREVSRLVANDLPKNGLSYFLSQVLKTEKKRGTLGLITFADNSPMMKGQHSGGIYKASNFRYVGLTSYNYRYVNDQSDIIPKKTLYNRAKKQKLTERRYAELNGWFKIPEWPKLKFEYIF